MSTDLYCPQVEQYRIAVDSDVTIRQVLDAFETDSDASAAFAEVLGYFPDSSLYLLPLLHRIRCEDFQPRDNDLPSVGDYGSRLHELQKIGVVTDIRDQWYETDSESYLSEGRVLTTFHVPQTVIPVVVRYRFPTFVKPYGYSYASSWEITAQLDPVPAGWYLIGETGDFRMDTVGVSYLGDSFDQHDDFACHAAEVEGFLASHCSAQCSACESQWNAESGSWTFKPEYGCDAAAWDFDDADGFELDNTITCPNCGTGRIGFMVF